MTHPNIVILLADDMGFGQVGYNNHPLLSTSNIDALASNGLRFNRFYSSGPFCSPTRAAILTGRAGDRCGVHRPFYRLRLQETTFVQSLKASGYVNGHFGKWHLSGFRGSPGAPVFTGDTHNPSAFGFDEWFANTCNIDPMTLMGDHNGVISENRADSSSAIANKACEFIEAASNSSTPFFANVWFSSPHSPFNALPQNKALFENMGLSENGENQLGMIVELDDAIGVIRQKLRDLNIENDTIVWFCSDNGGLPNVDPYAVGDLRGEKDTMYEGGLRVPCAVEWPTHIIPGVTNQLSYTSDIALTLCDITGADSTSLMCPQDGVSIRSVLLDGATISDRALPFHGWDRGALTSDKWKILNHKVKGVVEWELYDLENDPNETIDVASSNACIVTGMAKHFWRWYSSVRCSLNGLDYPETYVTDGYDPLAPHFFNDSLYAAYVDAWKLRPEYENPYMLSMIPDDSGQEPDLFYEPYCF